MNIDCKGCTNPGSGIRRIEAELAGINRKGQQDWYVLCETTPVTWDHVTYYSPTHCDERVSVIFCSCSPLASGADRVLRSRMMERNSQCGIFLTAAVEFIERIG